MNPSTETKRTPEEVRLNVRLKLEDRAKLRAALSLEGVTVQDWLEQQVKQKIGGYDFSRVQPSRVASA